MVAVCEGRIDYVGPRRTEDSPRDLGDVALLPGLVNAHTHLEFSDLSEPLGHPGLALPDWIARVVARRRVLAAEHETSIAAHVDEAMRRGLAECFAAGTTLLGEIASFTWTGEAWRDAPLDGVIFQEVLGLKAEIARERIAAAEEQLLAGRAAGLSPHAPYTVSLAAVAELAALARKHAVPCAMHLAESREEMELLASGTGPFRTILERLGAWDATVIPPGTRPLDYLERLAAAPRALAIHGNYFGRDEWDFLAARRAQMTLVHCPRTHAFFGHPDLPWRQLLEEGVAVALGTDSRASNPDLSLLEELRFLAGQKAALRDEEILRLGTLAGAAALGKADDHGSLEPGKLANLVALVLDKNASAADPYAAILHSDRAPIAVMRAGVWHSV